MPDPEDLVEGEGVVDFTADPTTDDLVPWVVLFASVLGHPARILVRAAEWRLLFGGPDEDPDRVMDRPGFLAQPPWNLH